MASGIQIRQPEPVCQLITGAGCAGRDYFGRNSVISSLDSFYELRSYNPSITGDCNDAAHLRFDRLALSQAIQPEAIHAVVGLMGYSLFTGGNYRIFPDC